MRLQNKIRYTSISRLDSLSDIDGEWVKSEFEPSWESLRSCNTCIEDGREPDLGVAPAGGENTGDDAPVSKGETDGERVTKGVMAGVKFGENAGEV